MQVDRLCAWVLWLLMFKLCGVFGISKIEFFNFSSTERVNDAPFVVRNLGNTALAYKLLLI